MFALLASVFITASSLGSANPPCCPACAECCPDCACCCCTEQGGACENCDGQCCAAGCCEEGCCEGSSCCADQARDPGMIVVLGN